VNGNLLALAILRSVRHSLKSANLPVARPRRDAALAGFPSNPIPANTVKLPVSFTSTKFQAPIKFPSARRGIGAARSAQQFCESPAAFKQSPAPQGQCQCKRGQNNNSNE
jgi:hypothetical protein